MLIFSLKKGGPASTRKNLYKQKAGQIPSLDRCQDQSVQCGRISTGGKPSIKSSILNMNPSFIICCLFSLSLSFLASASLSPSHPFSKLNCDLVFSFILLLFFFSIVSTQPQTVPTFHFNSKWLRRFTTTRAKSSSTRRTNSLSRYATIAANERSRTCATGWTMTAKWPFSMPPTRPDKDGTFFFAYLVQSTVKIKKYLF